MKNKVWLLLPTMVNIYIYMYIYITRKEYGDTVANYGHDKAVTTPEININFSTIHFHFVFACFKRKTPILTKNPKGDGVHSFNFSTMGFQHSAIS